MSGMIVTHFSFGSLRSNHGRSCSPLRIRREWKYLGGGAGWNAVLEPIRDGGTEPYGEANGFRTGARSMGSLSGDPALGVVVAVVVAVPWW